ncbi:protein MAIN-LIKE 1-like [Arachis ipaensis]|uniref:protein MAIN-LIKE 1-like n=1 Tax=Arachis ipaensis TaxID=130454 RepID=UPI000A2B4C1F|nr:protein MAIN-LIKE 1-like [Arachis ipaensis]
MSGGEVNVEENLNRLDKLHIAAHLFHKPTRVLTPHGTLVDVFMLEAEDPTMAIRRERLEPYLRRTGFYHASLIKRFEYDNPLISAFVERWRPETHTFHLPWGECTITLEDVAMQLGLPVDGQPVSGTLRLWSKFHQRDIWEWCHELLGEVPAGHVGTTKYNIKLKWLRTRLQQMPLNLDDNGLMQYARCYILYLLGGVLLPDKANNTVHVRYLPLLAEYDAIGTYSWGSAVLCWLYRAMCLATYYSVEGMAGCHTLLMSWIYYILPFWAPNVTTPYSFPLATRWAGKKGQNDYAEQRLLRHRLRLDNLQVDEFVWQPYLEPWILSRVPAEFLGHPHGDFYTAVVPLIFFRWIEILNVDRVLRQFGGKQGPPNPPLNIDTFHRQSARNDDGWWPVRLSEWFEVWANRRTDAYRLQIDRADTLRPSQDYYRWYSQRIRRFLSTPNALHDPRGDVVPADAPAEYGRGPVVNLPPVPRDHRRRRPRRVRVEDQAEHAEGEQDLPEQDRPSFEPDMGHHIPSHAPPAAVDYYYPQPVVSADPPSHLPFSKLCHIRVASRLGVHPKEVRKT